MITSLLLDILSNKIRSCEELLQTNNIIYFFGKLVKCLIVARRFLRNKGNWIHLQSEIDARCDVTYRLPSQISYFAGPIESALV